MIKYIKGNLLDTDCNIIIHGVNCQGVMGSGVAKAIRDKYPKVYKEYVEEVKRVEDTYGSKKHLLGRAFAVNIGPNHKLINLFSQEYYGRDGKQYVDYKAISDALEFLSCALLPNDRIAMPKIGAGLGGGDWKIIEKIIEDKLKNFEVYVYEL